MFLNYFNQQYIRKSVICFYCLNKVEKVMTFFIAITFDFDTFLCLLNLPLALTALAQGRSVTGHGIQVIQHSMGSANSRNPSSQGPPIKRS